MERTKYVVFKSNIKDEDGVKRFHGDVVELGSKLARRYNKLGFLRPYLDENQVDEQSEQDEDEDDEPVTATPVVHSRRRRSATPETPV